MAVIGLAVLLIQALAVILVPLIFRLDPISTDFEAGIYADPTTKHFLGTDSAGRDVFARLLYGGRISLMVSVLSTLISALIGIPLGMLAGYRRGRAETIIMRICDVFLSFPSTIIIMMLISFVGSSVWNVIAIMGVLGWTEFARQSYGKTLSVREKQYVEAAKATGCKDREILGKYIWPNAFTPCLIVMTYNLASAIITESSLSFLGVGIQPPTASWGNLMYDAKSITVLSSKIWIWMAPGLLIMLMVLSINFIGDGLRDAFDPKTETIGG